MRLQPHRAITGLVLALLASAAVRAGPSGLLAPSGSSHAWQSVGRSQSDAASGPIERYEASHPSMGTEFTVAVYGRDPKFLGETVEEVFEEIDRIDQQMSSYKPESELSQINRLAASQNVLVQPNLFALIETSLRFSEETGGAFDITVGPLMKAWGFSRGQGRVPSAADLSEVLKHVGYQHVKLDAVRRTLHFDVPGMELDLGGIAKGYAVDRAVSILRENGITDALVSSGMSSIYALGAPPGERGWKITLRDPFDQQKAADVIYLKNFSMSTSGSYNRFFKLGGKTYSHIMNPHSGMPVENMLSTTVFAASSTTSDALSKLFVLGVEGSRRYLATHPDILALFYVPAGLERQFKRVSLRSASYNLPMEVRVEVVR